MEECWLRAWLTAPTELLANSHNQLSSHVKKVILEVASSASTVAIDTLDNSMWGRDRLPSSSQVAEYKQIQ